MLPRSTRKTLKIVCSFCSNFPFLSIHQNITTFEIILHGILHGKFWKENMLFPKREFGSPFSSRSGKTPDLGKASPFLRIPILSRKSCKPKAAQIPISANPHFIKNVLYIESKQTKKDATDSEVGPGSQNLELRILGEGVSPSTK